MVHPYYGMLCSNSKLCSFGKLNNGPQKMSTSPEPINVTLYDQGEFAGVMKLRISRWEDGPGLSRWIQLQESSWEGGRITELVVVDTMMDTQGWSNQRKRSGAKECRCLQKLKKGRKQYLPWSLRKEWSPADTVTLAQWGWFDLGLLTSNIVR